MGVAVALAAHAGIDGARLFAAYLPSASVAPNTQHSCIRG